MWKPGPRGWRIRFSGSMWLLLALLALLPVMAWLQYRWIDQVSDAAGQRAQLRLDHAVEQIVTEFDGEITRAQLAFWQMPPGYDDPAGRFAARYRDWNRLAPYPQLIREIHLIETAGEPWRLSQVDSSGNVVALSEWPARLAAVKARVEEPGRRGPEPGFRRINGFDDLSVDGNPTFLVPIREPREPRREAEPDRRRRAFGPPLGWAAVTLDAEFIRREFLPELARRLFAQGGESDFELLVVKTAEPESIVFQSDPAASKRQFSSPDSTAGLFAVRPGCFFQEGPGLGAGAGPGMGPGPGPGLRIRRSDILTQKPTGCGAAARALGSTDGAWKLLVKHRAGSLATAVASFRLRTMAISFGVLLVLALGITMLTISTERARELAKLQMEFAMGISHELRTPLTVIRVAADNISSGMMENSRHAQKYGQLIGDEARRLTEMVEQILTFARARSGNGAELKPVAPEQIVSRALAACAPVLRDAGMIVEREVDSNLPEVQGDLNLMVDCVQNLINNAVKYAKSGGWVRVRAERAPDSGGSRIRIVVEDRGPGVSPGDLPHIFDPFYRGEAVRSSQIPGVGLGLSLVKRIVEAHRGTVTVESSSGLGATFYLYLPAQPPQVQPAGEMKQVTS